MTEAAGIRPLHIKPMPSEEQRLSKPKGKNAMDTLLRIIIALSFAGAATLTVWLLVEAADAVLRRKREDESDDGYGY